MKCPTKPLVFCAEQVLLRSSPPNEVFLDDVQVPAGSLLGEENDGWSRLMQSLNIERLLIAAACAGQCLKILEIASAFARARQNLASTRIRSLRNSAMTRQK